MKKLFVVIALAACHEFFGVPDDVATIDGTISTVTASSVLIERDVTKCERIVFTINSKTDILILQANGDRTKGTIADLTVGRKARGWADGPIAESCPAQAVAEAVEVR